MTRVLNNMLLPFRARHNKLNAKGRPVFLVNASPMACEEHIGIAHCQPPATIKKQKEKTPSFKNSLRLWLLCLLCWLCWLWWLWWLLSVVVVFWSACVNDAVAVEVCCWSLSLSLMFLFFWFSRTLILVCRSLGADLSWTKGCWLSDFHNLIQSAILSQATQKRMSSMDGSPYSTFQWA